MVPSSAELLDYFRCTHSKEIDLGLRPAYFDLLAAIGSPHLHLPATFLVAGTNGKGSTTAFLRAILEAAGRSVHVYTSPHLVCYHERIRIAGSLIAEEELASLLQEIKDKAPAGGLSIFEAGTAAALAAFARNKADITLLEVGLGGRLDATNVVPRPVASVITRLSFDHREYLGHTMREIAAEKAGIMRADIPCFTAAQPSTEALDSLRHEALMKKAPLSVGGVDWVAQAIEDQGFSFSDQYRSFPYLPHPALLGAHQIQNAGLAIAALAALPFTVDEASIRKGLQTVFWPGRLQPLHEGPLFDLLPKGSELWLDGGHNDSAGEVLATQCTEWKKEKSLPIYLIYGMLSTKSPQEYLSPLKPFIDRMVTVQVNGEVPGFSPETLAQMAQETGITDVQTASSLEQAIAIIVQKSPAPFRLMICGSLYLVGAALKKSVAPFSTGF